MRFLCISRGAKAEDVTSIPEIDIHQLYEPPAK